MHVTISFVIWFDVKKLDSDKIHDLKADLILHVAYKFIVLASNKEKKQKVCLLNK